ncbi:pca operon transcription factor PcaQ [Natronohydrobacter thiooxidans]|uniref:pca operon transcription factor PcaQ n=1 Tax=Natronohydrobacter thiooxidans TaxID=87172 RepID=UPI0008FF77F1|nr:pca operon transcription factor PcaQ [Natronohydrobacter thiooxidans]
MERRIKFRHLEIFTAVARAASLKRAAERLNLTQPAVSKTLKELEDITGHVLAERSRAGLRLTPEGEVFLQYAEQSTAAIRHGLRSLQGAGQAASRLRIGALPSVAGAILPAAARSFAAANPDTLLEVTEGPHLDLIARLRSGGLDLVLGRLGRPESMAGLSFQQLYTEEVVIVARPDSPAVSIDSFADLDGFLVLYPPRETAIRPLVARMLIAQGVALFPNRIESASSAFGRALTLAEPNVVWFISLGVVADDLAKGNLVQLALPTAPTRGAVGIMSRANEVIPAPARAFSRHLATQIRGRV